MVRLRVMQELRTRVHHIENCSTQIAGLLSLAAHLRDNRERYLSPVEMIDALSVTWYPLRLSIARRFLLILYLHD